MSKRFPRGDYLYLANDSHLVIYDDQQAHFAGLLAWLRKVDANAQQFVELEQTIQRSLTPFNRLRPLFRLTHIRDAPLAHNRVLLGETRMTTTFDAPATRCERTGA